MITMRIEEKDNAIKEAIFDGSHPRIKLLLHGITCTAGARQRQLIRKCTSLFSCNQQENSCIFMQFKEKYK